MESQQSAHESGSIPNAPAPSQSYIPCISCQGSGCAKCDGSGHLLCEQCHNPIEAVRCANNNNGAKQRNQAAKRFCSAKCRSYKFWLDNKGRLQRERKTQTVGN